MSIALTCDCTKAYSVPDRFAGREFRCKRCDEILRVPRDDAEEEKPKKRVRRRRPRRSQRAAARTVDWHDEPETPSRRPARRRRARDDEESRRVVRDEPEVEKKRKRKPTRARPVAQSEPSEASADASSMDELELFDRPAKERRARKTEPVEAKAKAKKNSRKRLRRGDTVRSEGRLNLLTESDLKDLPRTRRAKRRPIESEAGSDSQTYAEVSSDSEDAELQRERRKRERRARKDAPKKAKKRSSRDEDDETVGKKKPISKLGKNKPLLEKKKPLDLKKRGPRGGGRARPEATESARLEQKKALIVIGGCVGALLLVMTIIIAMSMGGSGGEEAAAAANAKIAKMFDDGDAFLAKGNVVEAQKSYEKAIAELALVTDAIPAELAGRRDTADDLLADIDRIARVVEAGGLRDAKEEARRDRLAAIETAAGHDHEGIRLAATMLLANASDPETVPLLSKLAKSTNDQISARAQQALIQIGCPEALPYIEKFIDADGTPMQEVAIQALLQIEDPETAPLLGKALGKFGSNPEAAERILDRLHTLADPRALSDLEAFASSAEGDIAAMAQEVIDRTKAAAE